MSGQSIATSGLPPQPGASLPDASGHFDRFGGRFVPEALYAALLQLEREFHAAIADPAFKVELGELLADYTGRPSPITEAERFSQHAMRTATGQLPIIVLKREDLNHTGSHKINNVIGQALLTRRMGKTRVIAETGAGQHGVATATAAALFGFDCTVYMGKVDTERQALNVARMRLLGAEVIAVESGTQTLKDAMNDAMRDWVASVDNTHYLIGSVAGPHPFPMMVREFQRVIGREARAQLLDRYDRLPDAVVCYLDSTVALPLLTSYALAVRGKRPLRRLDDRRRELMDTLRSEYERAGGEPASAEMADATLPMHR